MHGIDELNEMPPHDNALNGEKRINFCINLQMYQLINEKKNRLQALKRERDKLLDNFNEKNQSLFTKHELTVSIMNKKTSVELLKNEVVQSDKRLTKLQEEVEMAKKRVYRKRQMLDFYLDKISKCKDTIKKLIELEKQRIEELNRFIFELTEIKPKDEDMLQKSTRTALKDARQTVFVNDRWIRANDQAIYRIVRSVLPTDGSYMSYYRESSQKDDEDKLKDEQQQLEAIERQYQAAAASNTLSSRLNVNLLWSSTSSSGSNSTLSILPANRLIDRSTVLSGLTYTVQFVNLIAFYLNILLPYNLSANKFFNQSLKENQFQNAVAKLNTNIIYLSISQHVKVNNLLPKHTLENLHHFLVCFKDMKVKLRDKHSISFPSHMIPMLDEMFTESDEDSLMQDSLMPNLIFNDSEEWETVPNSNEIPSDDTYNSFNVRQRAVSSSLISSVLSQFWFKNNSSGSSGGHAK